MWIGYIQYWNANYKYWILINPLGIAEKGHTENKTVTILEPLWLQA